MHPIWLRLIRIMHNKETNLCIAVDVTSGQELLSIVNVVGREICMLKIHADIIEDWSDDLARKLVAAAREHKFLIFEDRKFSDVGHIVRRQYEKGCAEWADIVTCHIACGVNGLVGGEVPGALAALQDVGAGRGLGVLLVVQMSDAAKRESMTVWQKKHIAEIAEKCSVVVGFITQEYLGCGPWIQCAPGVRLQGEHGQYGQEYQDVESVIARGIDVIIVGSGITVAALDAMAGKAAEYRKRGWAARALR